MFFKILFGLMLPLIGTTLGGALGAFLCKRIRKEVEGGIFCFAGGVMIAASVFSLIIPAVRYAEEIGNIPLLPVSVGFTLGALFLLITEEIFSETERPNTKPRLDGRGRMILAVTLHNFPEGMAVGVVFAGLLASGGMMNFGEALALSFGIALQNLPEGAIISLPLRASGSGRGRAFLCSFLSGVVEPIGALIMLFAAGLFLPILPYVLGFSAGAMVYSVVDGLTSISLSGKYSALNPVMFSLGFFVMCFFDIAFS
ncbi:MAG: ZIP family metal transporter [Clostridia bacterium]|nr:ZIP family metal transporter [Clostridia bacterium]